MTEKEVKILVVGDVIVDRYHHVVAEKLSQETLLPILKVVGTENRPGGAGKTAKVLNDLLQYFPNRKIQSTYIGLVPDFFGEMFRKDAVVLPLSEKPEDFFCYKTRVVSSYPYQQITRFDRDVTLDLSEHSHVEDVLKRNIRNYFRDDSYNIALVSDYDRGIINERILSCIRDYADLVIVDPRKKDLSFYKKYYCDIMLPNDMEYKRYETKDKQLVKSFLDAGTIVQKVGPKGCIVHNKNESMFVKTHEEEPLSVVGAGDVFAAAFTLGLGLDILFGKKAVPFETVVQFSAEMANTLAGLAVTNRLCEPNCTEELDEQTDETLLNFGWWLTAQRSLK